MEEVDKKKNKRREVMRKSPNEGRREEQRPRARLRHKIKRRQGPPDYCCSLTMNKNCGL